MLVTCGQSALAYGSAREAHRAGQTLQGQVAARGEEIGDVGGGEAWLEAHTFMGEDSGAWHYAHTC